MTSMEDVEKFVKENLFEVLQLRNKWLFETSKSPIEIKLFQNYVQLIFGSKANYMKSGPKTDRLNKMRAFDLAIRNWIRKNLPNVDDKSSTNPLDTDDGHKAVEVEETEKTEGAITVEPVMEPPKIKRRSQSKEFRESCRDQSPSIVEGNKRQKTSSTRYKEIKSKESPVVLSRDLLSPVVALHRLSSNFDRLQKREQKQGSVQTQLPVNFTENQASSLPHPATNSRQSSRDSCPAASTTSATKSCSSLIDQFLNTYALPEKNIEDERSIAADFRDNGTVKRMFESLRLEMRGSFQQLLHEIKSSSEAVRRELVEEIDHLHTKINENFEDLAQQNHKICQRLDDLTDQLKNQNYMNNFPDTNERHDLNGNRNVIEIDLIPSLVPPKISTKDDLDSVEVMLLSNDHEDIEYKKNLVATFSRSLKNNNNNFSGRESMVACFMEKYFEGSFLKSLSWANSEDRIDLKKYKGHLNLIYDVVNCNTNGTFQNFEDLHSSLQVVLGHVWDTEGANHKNDHNYWNPDWFEATFENSE